MARNDGTRIGMGGTLIGLGGAGMVALLIYASEVAFSEHGSAWHQVWFLVVFALSACMAIAGAYVLGAVWFPLPLPPTWIERAFQARLEGTKAEAHSIVEGDVVFRVSTFNAGRSNIDGAYLNVVVPGFFTHIELCSELGETAPPEHAGTWSRTPESLIKYQPELDSIYWNGKVSFPGRTHRVAYFRVTKPGIRHNFPVRLMITAPELEETFSGYFDVRASDLTQQVPEPDGRES